MSSVKGLILLVASLPAAHGMRRKAGGDMDFNSMWSSHQQANGTNASLSKIESVPVPAVAAELDALVKSQPANLISPPASDASLVEEQVVPSLPSNTSLAKKESVVQTLAPVALSNAEPCNTLLWNLAMQSKKHDGWKGVRLVLSHCNGTVLHEKTLASGNMAQESICLPVLFNIDVRAASKVDGLEWNLMAEGARDFAGGAPFRGGFCQPGEPLSESLVQMKEVRKPSAWSQWWTHLHQKELAFVYQAVAHFTMNETQKHEMWNLVAGQTFRFVRAGRVG